MKKIRTHYDNLQVAENASIEVIKGAYRYLLQKWHPDRNPERRTLAERYTKIINQAYEVLSDPQKRREYDLRIEERRKRQRWEEALQENTRATVVPPDHDNYHMHYGGHSDNDAPSGYPGVVSQDHRNEDGGKSGSLDASGQGAWVRFWLKMEGEGGRRILKILATISTLLIVLFVWTVYSEGGVVMPPWAMESDTLLFSVGLGAVVAAWSFVYEFEWNTSSTSERIIVFLCRAWGIVASFFGSIQGVMVVYAMAGGWEPPVRFLFGGAYPLASITILGIWLVAFLPYGLLAAMKKLGIWVWDGFSDRA